MTTRRIVHTGRQKILLNHINIDISEEPGGGWGFSVRVNLEPYKLPKTAKVFVEAYDRTAWERFDMGIVSGVSPRTVGRFTLKMIPERDGVLFRIKVTATEARKGVLLAGADRIAPKAPGEGNAGKRPLLHVCQGFLDGPLYELDIKNDWPTLVINREVPNWRETARNSWFQSLVHPAVIREIATNLYLSQRLFDEATDTDGNGWEDLWLRYLRELASGTMPDSDDWEDVSTWIDLVVSAFAQSRNLLGLYKKGEE